MLVQDHEWDYMDRTDNAQMEHFINCIIERMRHCQIVFVNYDKISEVTQGPEENPALFLSQLSKPFRKFTNVDPDSCEGHILLVMHLIIQASLDVQREIQKLKTGPKTRQAFLVVEPFKNQDQAEEARKNKGIKRKAQILDAMIQGPSEIDPRSSRTLRL